MSGRRAGRRGRTFGSALFFSPRIAASYHKPFQIRSQGLERQPELFVIGVGVNEVIPLVTLPEHAAFKQGLEAALVDADHVALRHAVEVAQEMGRGRLGIGVPAVGSISRRACRTGRAPGVWASSMRR